MGRQTKKCPKKCTRHLFSLKPVHYSAFFSRESQFEYCPQNSKTEPNIPKFNRDGKPYTAAFILATDQVLILLIQLKLLENDKIYQIEHERFKKLNHEEKSEILIPKPKSKSSFCNVCKDQYDDYQDVPIILFQHISSQKHKQTIKDSDFNEQILKLCRNFGNHLKISPKIVSYEELKSSFHLNETTCFSQNIGEKPSGFEFEELELFLQKSTKDNLDALSFFRSMKSFHTFGQNGDLKVENVNEHNFLQCSLNKELNENGFFPPTGNMKLIEQTASPIKTKFDRPIILTGRSFTLDD